MTPPLSASRSEEVDVASVTPPVRTVGVLTKRLTAGDEQAFREFHARYFDRLFRFLIVLTHGHEQQAEEALQETLLRVVRYIRPFEDEAVFWCWLTALGRSAVRDHGRKRRRYQVLLERYALRFLCLLTGPIAEEHDPQLQEQLAQCLSELAPEDQSLLQAKYYAGASVKDLVRKTGQTEKAIESKLFRLRRSLRERLLSKLQEENP